METYLGEECSHTLCPPPRPHLPALRNFKGHPITIDIVGKQPNQHTFVVAPHRWLAERTLAILGRARRLSKDYEREDLYSEAMVYLASINSLLRRLAPDARTTTRYHITSTAA